jgi:hypothetical protein
MAAEDKACTLTGCHGTHYDLTSLTSSEDYATTAHNSTYKLNVCRSVASELWMDDPEDVGGFISREGGDFSLGWVADPRPSLYIAER